MSASTPYMYMFSSYVPSYLIDQSGGRERDTEL